MQSLDYIDFFIFQALGRISFWFMYDVGLLNPDMILLEKRF